MIRMEQVLLTRHISRGTTALQLCHSQLGSAEPLSEFHDLELLDLSHNLLSTLPSLAHMRRLRVLDLSHNRLSRLPELPPMLQTLRFAHNRIQDASALLSAQELTHVDASFNLLKALPTAWRARLHFLDLRVNQLTGPPQWQGFAVTLLLAENPLPPPGENGPNG
jgi:Leucine-rich repeat (LRR) protein